MFQVLATQIRVGGLGGFVGFDLSSIEVLLLAYDVPVREWRFVLDKIALLTTIAHKYWNTDKEEDKPKSQEIK